MRLIGLRWTAGLAVLSVAGLLVAGLQSKTTVASTVPAVRFVSHAPEPAAHRAIIDVGEMYFRVRGQPPGAPLVLRAGEKTELVFWNESVLFHEIHWGRDVVTIAGRPDGYAVQLFEGVEVETRGKMAGNEWLIEAGSLLKIRIHPRQRLRMIFTLPAEKRGSWEMGSFQPGRYEAGQRHSITVK